MDYPDTLTVTRPAYTDDEVGGRVEGDSATVYNARADVQIERKTRVTDGGRIVDAGRAVAWLPPGTTATAFAVRDDCAATLARNGLTVQGELAGFGENGELLIDLEAS